LNSTWDELEGRWKAVDVAEIKRNAPYYQAAFESRFAIRLRELGFDVVATEKGYEIAGIPEKLIRLFSRRTERIESRAQELGITDARQKDSLGARTREAKGTVYRSDELRALWWSKLDEAERLAVQAVMNRDVILTPRDPNIAREAIFNAANHCFERESVVSVDKLLTTALRFGIG
jgi:hypothetical protein